MRKRYVLQWRGQRLELGERTCIMGVVNVTPDSFSDGGKFFSNQTAIAHGQKMAEDGADIIDIGGESTRPFSDAVSAAEELRRVIPVIAELVARISVPISIDTTKAEVARRAIEAGASIINDISALRLDPEMPKVAAQSGAPLILMHMLGTPKNMQVSPTYDDVVAEIKTFLDQSIRQAVNSGIDREKIIIDPGIGFGKSFEHNLTLIRQLSDFHTLDAPILIGPSRKAFIRNILKGENRQNIPPDLPIVETGTQAVISAAILNGAHIVRVHDVANTCATVKLVDAIVNA